MSESEKICTGCDKSKPLSEFYEQATGRLGRRASCKRCDCARALERWRKQKQDPHSEAEQRRVRAAIYASACALADGDCAGGVRDYCPDARRLGETLPICKRHRAWVGRLERAPTYARLVSLFKFRRRF